MWVVLYMAVGVSSSHSTIRSRVHVYTHFEGVLISLWMRSCGLCTHIYHRVYVRSVFFAWWFLIFLKKVETDLVNFWLSNRYYTVWLTTSNYISFTRRIFTCGHIEKKGVIFTVEDRQSRRKNWFDGKIIVCGLCIPRSQYLKLKCYLACFFWAGVLKIVWERWVSIVWYTKARETGIILVSAMKNLCCAASP